MLVAELLFVILFHYVDQQVLFVVSQSFVDRVMGICLCWVIKVAVIVSELLFIIT